MLEQIFRNRIYESRSLKYRIKKIETLIRSNLSQKENVIVKKLTSLWNSQTTIDLKPYHFSGTTYPLRIEFHQLFTHGPPYVKIKDKISTNYGQLEYDTEYGDLAFVVEYLFQGKRLGRKVSILQSKKEKSKDKMEIPFHQHYLMAFWPDIEFPSKPSSPSKKFSFNGVCPDEFSFYHFILNHSHNPVYSSSICSAPFVGLKLGIWRQNIEKSLSNWCNLRKANPKIQPPSQTLFMPLLPGGIYRYGKYYEWNLLAKPFTRFILDAAYLYVGTDNISIFELALERVPNVLLMRVVGGREEDEFHEDQNLIT